MSSLRLRLRKWLCSRKGHRYGSWQNRVGAVSIDWDTGESHTDVLVRGVCGRCREWFGTHVDVWAPTAALRKTIPFCPKCNLVHNLKLGCP